MLRTILLVLLVSHIQFGNAQTIHDSIRVDWSQAGVQQFFVDSSNVLDVTTFGATGNGVSNDLPAVQSAFAALSGQSGIVYFPPGNYIINGTINIPDSVVIKGASSGLTALIFNLGGVTGNCINVWKPQTLPFYPVQDGYQKGSFKLVTDSAMIFNPGDYAELRQQNGSWDTNPAFWADYSAGQMLRVTGINGDTLYVEQAIRMDYDPSLNVEIRKIIPRVNIGIECVSVTRTDSTAPGVNYGIYANAAAQVRIRGVEMHRTIGAMIWAEYSTAMEISGCYFHHAYEYSGSNNRGYGVVMASHTGECKIENNIFRRLRHAMMVKQGANGNVFGYNYSIEPFRTEFPNDAGGDISLHGHYPFANLFEGNICQNLMIDQAWGPSGPFNTFFRNRIELYGIILSSGTVNTNKNNFVGNDITGTGPFQGNYLLTGTGHFEYGNNDNGVIKPTGTSALPDTSCYLDSFPAFWNIASPFPNIGTPNPVTGQNIPARERYVTTAAELTICGPDTVTTGLNSYDKVSTSEIQIYPNPADDRIYIIYDQKAGDKNVSVVLRNIITGVQFLKPYSPKNVHDRIEIDISNLPAGTYVIQIKSDLYSGSALFVKSTY